MNIYLVKVKNEHGYPWTYAIPGNNISEALDKVDFSDCSVIAVEHAMDLLPYDKALHEINGRILGILNETKTLVENAQFLADDFELQGVYKRNPIDAQWQVRGSVQAIRDKLSLADDQLALLIGYTEERIDKEI